MGYNYQDAPRESQQEYFGKKTKRVVDLENQVRFMGMQIDNLKAICKTDNTETLNNALKRIEELEAQIEKMKCCGNCKGVCTSDDVARFCKNNDYKLWEIRK